MHARVACRWEGEGGLLLGGDCVGGGCASLGVFGARLQLCWLSLVCAHVGEGGSGVEGKQVFAARTLEQQWRMGRRSWMPCAALLPPLPSSRASFHSEDPKGVYEATPPTL
jgi:hypothetical protein